VRQRKVHIRRKTIKEGVEKEENEEEGKIINLNSQSKIIK
jgi:hypothetical protein